MHSSKDHGLVGAALATAVLLAITLTSVIAQAQPCPATSKDRWFTFNVDVAHCELGAAEGQPVPVTSGRAYNVYCPGRMTKENTGEVALALLKVKRFPNDTTYLINIPGNRIPDDYTTPYGLVPTLRAGVSSAYHASWSVDHLSHYNCERNGVAGVATHFKLAVYALPEPSKIAEFAKLVNQSGTIWLGKTMEREYKLTIHIVAGSRVAKSKAVGRAALARDAEFLSQIRTRRVRACVLPSTDIQCNPCTATQTSDKLVVRVQFVERERACPPDSVWIQ